MKLRKLWLTRISVVVLILALCSCGGGGGGDEGAAPAIRAIVTVSIIGGVLAFLAYALVIWAMTLTPMTYISALRETSVIVAALIGATLLGEPFGRRRVIAAAGVAFGVVLLQFSQGT